MKRVFCFWIRRKKWRKEIHVGTYRHKIAVVIAYFSV